MPRAARTARNRDSPPPHTDSAESARSRRSAAARRRPERIDQRIAKAEGPNVAEIPGHARQVHRLDQEPRSSATALLREGRCAGRCTNRHTDDRGVIHRPDHAPAGAENRQRSPPRRVVGEQRVRAGGDRWGRAPSPSGTAAPERTADSAGARATTRHAAAPGPLRTARHDREQQHAQSEIRVALVLLFVVVAE